MQNLNWNNIRSINNSQKDGFEELVCQLAKNDEISGAKTFVRKGSPDAGVECFWILNNNKEICYQAKFFTAPLSSTQWSEIDDSVRTALEKHPNIIKYIVSIPQDRADARIKGRKSFLDKWNESVMKWQQWANEKSIAVDFVYEGSSELFQKLTVPKNIGKTLFWFNKEEFSEEWFKKQNEAKIKDLGVRYSPEINVDSTIKYIFDGIYLNTKFNTELKDRIEEADKQFKNFLTLSNDLLEFNTFLTDRYNELNQKLKTLNGGVNKFNKTKILYEYIHNYIAAFVGEKKSFDTIPQVELKKRLKDDFDKFLTSLYFVYSGLHNLDAKLADIPYLLLEGEAGIGKSHLIADVITESFNNDNFSILLLGQHFYKGDVWTQIKNQLDIKGTKEEFLGAINSKAETYGSRIIIYIDALNEGDGKYIWKEQLAGFIEDLKFFPNVGLVLSIRDTYKNLVLPEDFTELVSIYRLTGFDDTFMATKKFFEYYKLQEPPIPLLNPEFNNPLFLKLFCKGLRDNGISSIPQDYDNLDTIFNYLIQSVNKSLSLKFDFDSKDFNLVKSAISVIVTEMIKSPSFHISRSTARKILIDEFKNEVDNSRNILSELIKENILTENVLYNNKTGSYDKEIIYFSYERMGDYFISQTLLEKDIEEIRTKGIISKDSNIYDFIKDENSIMKYEGFIEILSILLPERIGFELYELIDLSQDYYVGEAFIKSLLWRNTSTITEKINNYLNDAILPVRGLHSLFLNTLIQLSFKRDHYLNAYFLNDFLLDMTLRDRDYFWTIYINDSDVATTFSNWVLESRVIEAIDEESKKMISLVLTWFLTASNRELRDVSTKGLVRIFQNDLALFEKLLLFTKDINDLYVQERIFASAYGATLRTKNNEQIGKFASFIFDLLFKDKNPPEHHLLRDYARGIVEYASFLNLINVDMEQVRPPYKSVMPAQVPSMEEVESFKVDKKGFSTQNSLYELVMGFSDFARYTLGTNHYSRISNITIESYRVYESLSRSKSKRKELGNVIELCKNYKSEFVNQQWKDKFKNLYENLVEFLQVKFNLSLEDSKSLYDYIDKISNDYYKSSFNIQIIQRLIVHDVFKTFAWEDEYFSLHDYRDLRDSYFNKETYSRKESIGKKYVLMSYYKWMAIILDNYLTQLDYTSGYDDKFQIYSGGGWSTSRRDIDPTILDRIYYREDSYQNNATTFWYPENNIDWDSQNYPKWVLDSKDLVHPKNLIDVTDDSGKEWLNLYSYPSWYGVKSNLSKKQVWYHIKSFIINNEDKIDIINALKNKDFFNHKIPQEQDIYEVFSREYYWSKAYEDCSYESDPDSDRKLHSELIDKNIVGYPTSMNYLWYEHRDFSLEQNINIKRPKKYLYNLLDLHLEQNEYEFYDSNNRVVLFNPAIKFQKGNDCLLVDKQYLIDKLKSENLDIIWLVLGAKEVISDMTIINEGDINSIFSLNEINEVQGDFVLKPYKER